MRLGVLPLGRPTFDVSFANQKLAAMLAALDATGHDLRGPRELLFDADSTHAAIAGLRRDGVDQVVLLQVTFTDASMTVAAAAALDAPLSIWAVPEPRAGGRLRLNSFCGLNLAAHALGRNERQFSWLYAEPSAPDIAARLDDLLGGRLVAGRLDAATGSASPGAHARDLVAGLAGRRLGRIGDHPEGFDTCAYSPEALLSLAGVRVDELSLPELFDRAKGADPAAVDVVRREAQSRLDGLEEVDQAELDRSLRLRVALDGLRREGRYDAFAIRCWPETFTEYGGAVCGPVSMMGEARVPCACEADVYGALTQLILQQAADAPVFLTDLVDMDAADDTGVVWHCGQAPVSMLPDGARAAATIHTNRRMPLLYEFALRPGRVTFLRISQAHGRQSMVLAGGEMLDRPMSFTGTSGVVRFDRPAGDVLDDIIAAGLEHHMALAYGEHRPLLREVAAAMDLPVLEI